jgi:hypothetical protein
MRKPLTLWALTALLFGGAAHAGAQSVTVFVHDFSHTGQPGLKRALNEAARIVRTAGVEIDWVYCPDSLEASPECRKAPGSTDLVLHLLPAGTTRRDARPGALGFAVPSESGGFGAYAGVLHDRVERLSSPVVGKSVVLGHAIAHELGHLLLGIGGHAPQGIMKSDWHRTELKKAAQGTLVFLEQERGQIQDNVRRRFSAIPENRVERTELKDVVR